MSDLEAEVKRLRGAAYLNGLERDACRDRIAQLEAVVEAARGIPLHLIDGQADPKNRLLDALAILDRSDPDEQ